MAAGPSSSSVVAATKHASQIDEWLARMPIPPKSGDPAKDKAMEGTVGLLKLVVAGCLQQTEHIIEVRRAYQDDVSKVRLMFHPSAPREQQFSELTSFIRVDVDELAQAIAAATDLGPKEIEKLVNSTEKMATVFEAVFQIPPGLKMLPQLQIKQVFRAFLAEQADLVGTPWDACGAKGAVTLRASELFPEKLPACVPMFTGEKLAKVKHRTTGDEVACEIPRTKRSVMRNCWSDWRATYPQDPMPEYKLHLLFKKSKTGPYSQIGKEYGAKCSKYEALVDQVFAKWKLAEDGTVVKSDLKKVAEEGLKERQKLDSAKRKV